MSAYRTQMSSFRPKISGVRRGCYDQTRQVLISRQSRPVLLSEEVLRPAAEELLRFFGGFYATRPELSNRYAQDVLRYESQQFLKPRQLQIRCLPYCPKRSHRQTGHCPCTATILYGTCPTGPYCMVLRLAVWPTQRHCRPKS